jgi:tRNA(fMet)-specific endonuclease VapC
VSEALEAAEALFLPAVVLGELYHGAFHGSQREKELRLIGELLPAVTVLGITAVTAEHFGQISAELARAGTPIPTNDIWVASLAREHCLPVATGDAHFTQNPFSFSDRHLRSGTPCSLSRSKVPKPSRSR